MKRIVVIFVPVLLLVAIFFKMTTGKTLGGPSMATSITMAATERRQAAATADLAEAKLATVEPAVPMMSETWWVTIVDDLGIVVYSNDGKMTPLVTLKKGNVMRVGFEGGDWMRVEFDDGRFGFIMTYGPNGYKITPPYRGW